MLFLGLQMGTNVGASQAGMTFGKNRMIIDWESPSLIRQFNIHVQHWLKSAGVWHQLKINAGPLTDQQVHALGSHHGMQWIAWNARLPLIRNFRNLDFLLDRCCLYYLFFCLLENWSWSCLLKMQNPDC